MAARPCSGNVRFKRIRELCPVEPGACGEASDNSMMKIRMRGSAVEKSITRSQREVDKGSVKEKFLAGDSSTP